MYIKRNYGFFMTFNWSKKPFFIGLAGSAIVTSIYYFGHIDLSFPWQPLSLLGIAVAFYLGFKNNSSYDRTWEARKIWGGIVNSSRSLGAMVVAFMQHPDQERLQLEQRKIIYRHIAWLTALRFQLRLVREWEHKEDRVKGLYLPTICEAYYDKLDDELMNLIDDKEFASYKSKANMAAQLLATQSVELQRLKDEGFFEDFRHMEFHRIITALYDNQGASERIKNFPFPRQYASTALWTTLVFCILMPFGLLDTLKGLGDPLLVWFTVPSTALITWVFFLMEKIGDYSENPFEGTYNDVPISSISRGIEIDLREMINDSYIPPAIQANHGFLM